MHYAEQRTSWRHGLLVHRIVSILFTVYLTSATLVLFVLLSGCSSASRLDLSKSTASYDVYAFGNRLTGTWNPPAQGVEDEKSSSAPQKPLL